VARGPGALLGSSAGQRRRNVEGYLFISPWLIGLMLWHLGPLLASLAISFTDWEILTTPRFVGLDNYVRMFTNDDLFWTTLFNTLYFVLGSVPLRLGLALLLALMLNRKRPGMRLFRTIFYLPSVTAGVAVAIIWLWMFDPSFGVINSVLRLFGVPGPPWLGHPSWAMPALIVMNLVYGGAQMVIFLAGLQSIPDHLYDAAAVDGANDWVQFRHVTLPMLSPTIFFNLVIGVISSFQVFTAAYVMTKGGPINSTLVYVLNLYNEAFRFLHMGYASALAWVLVAIVMALTLLQFKLSSWVYYEGKS
jgi:multiple sugar transport system permease protein